MELNISIGDFTDNNYYNKIRKPDEYFSTDFLSQSVNIEKENLIVNINGLLKSKHLKSEQIYPISEHLISFLEIDLIKISENMPTTNFPFDDIDSFWNYLVNIFGEKTAVTQFLPTLGTDFKIAFERYFEYLIDLQKEYSEILKFCFDVDFYPERLSSLTPLDRLSVYQLKYNRNIDKHIMKKTFAIPKTDIDLLTDNLIIAVKDRTRKATELGYVFTDNKNSTKDGIVHSERPDFPDTRDDFEKEFNLFVGLMPTLNSRKKDLLFNYTCDNLEDFLFLEFATMCENFVKIKKCKRCGRYFILKGNYQTDYCDRINSNGRTCQQNAASEKYKEKTRDNIAWKLYSKYYKRYFARIRVGTIKEQDFRKWQYKATMLRDECSEENLSEQEFESFLSNSFPNRKKKNI